MIQCPAARTFDLDLIELARSGQQTVAAATSNLFHPLQSLFIFARLARLSRERGALAGLQLCPACRRHEAVLLHRLMEPPSNYAADVSPMQSASDRGWLKTAHSSIAPGSE